MKLRSFGLKVLPLFSLCLVGSAVGGEGKSGGGAIDAGRLTDITVSKGSQGASSGAGGNPEVARLLLSPNNSNYIRANFGEAAERLFLERLNQVSWQSAQPFGVEPEKSDIVKQYSTVSNAGTEKPVVILNMSALKSLPPNTQSLNLVWETFIATAHDAKLRKKALDLDAMLIRGGVSWDYLTAQRMLFIKSDFLPQLKIEDSRLKREKPRSATEGTTVENGASKAE